MKALFLAENSASEFSLPELSGRDAWAPNELVDAGAAGFAPVTHPGPRWSGYVDRLRHQSGLAPSRLSTSAQGAVPGHSRMLRASGKCARLVSRERGRVVAVFALENAEAPMRGPRPSVPSIVRRRAVDGKV